MLYLLRPTKKLLDSGEHFQFANSNGLAIRASTETEARALAAAAKVNEWWWLNPILTTCHAIETDGPSEIVMTDGSAWEASPVT